MAELEKKEGVGFSYDQVEKKEGVGFSYDQEFINEITGQDGFPKKVFDLLQQLLAAGNPPSISEIEQALDETGVQKLETPILDKGAMQRLRAELGYSLEEMDNYIGLPPGTYQQWEVLGYNEATIIASPLLGEAIAGTMREGETVSLSQAIDGVVGYLKKTK